MDPDQIRANNAKVAEARRLVADAQRPEDLLGSQQIREVRALLGLTQAEASQIFRGGTNAFSKYERGEVIQSESMDLLIRLARDVPEATEWLRARAGLTTAEAIINYAVLGSTTWNTMFGGHSVQGSLQPEMSFLVLESISASNEDVEFSNEWQNQAPIRLAAGCH